MLKTFLAWLDHRPSGPVLAVGVGLGLGLGILALQAGSPGIVGALVVGLGAVVLALSGEPVWIDDKVDEPAVREPADLLEMAAIEGGTFLMGSPEDEPGRRDHERQHQVTVSPPLDPPEGTVSPFLMSAATVTRALYEDVMGVDDAPGPGGDHHPVTEVTWYQAVEFCNRASEKAGFDPCYRIEGESVEWVADNGYRLPTEAEWEYAARAGTTTRWSFGDDEAKLGEYAWFSGNTDRSEFSAREVKTRRPNPWQLYDMHGNVWEWCWDLYAEYPEGPGTDPRGPSKTPSALRVLRGGSFADEPGALRSAYRNWNEPESRVEVFGFRCVRRPRLQP